MRKRVFATGIPCLALLALTACTSPQDNLTLYSSTTPQPVVTAVPSAPAPTASSGLVDTSIITYTYSINGAVNPDKARTITLTIGKTSTTLSEKNNGKVTQETVDTSSAVWDKLVSSYPSISTLQSGPACGGAPGKAIDVSGATGSLYAVGYQKCGSEWSNESTSIDAWVEPAMRQFS